MVCYNEGSCSHYALGLFAALQLRDLESRLLQERDEKAVLAGAAAIRHTASDCLWLGQAGLEHHRQLLRVRHTHLWLCDKQAQRRCALCSN
jgi:hypothetical protein